MYCDVWEEKDFTGNHLRFSYQGDGSRWYNETLDKKYKLGSWKCTDNTRIWFRENNKVVSGSRGFIQNGDATRDKNDG